MEDKRENTAKPQLVLVLYIFAEPTRGNKPLIELNYKKKKKRMKVKFVYLAQRRRDRSGP